MPRLTSQIEQRRELDRQITENSYARLAASVSSTADAPVVHSDDLQRADGAARIAMRYYGAQPGRVPDGITQVEEYLDYLFAPSGVMQRRVRLEGDWHKRAFGAMIARLDNGDPVALIPRRLGGYNYYDPATGSKTHVSAKVAERISEEALLLYRALPKRPLSVRDLMAFMASVFDVGDYATVVVAAVVATVVGLLPAWANQVAFGVVVPSGKANLIMPICMLLVGVAASSVILGACRNLVMTRVELKLGVATEAAIFSRMLSLPTGFYRKYSSGNLATRAAQMKTLTELLCTILLGAGLTAVCSLIYLVQIAVFAGPLVGPALVTVLLQAFITVLAAVVTARYDRMTMDANVKLSGTVTALLAGISKIKLAGAERRAFAKWSASYVPYANSSYMRPVLVRAVSAITSFLGFVGIAVIYWFAGSAHVSLADFMSFNVAFGQMQAAILALAATAATISQIGPMFDMIEPILSAQPEDDEARPGVDSLSGAIEVSGVTFRYGPDQPYVLRDLSFKIKPGEYVAIVGKSGCGKSTILRLLLGFEEPERGSVFYGSYDVGKVDLRSLRRHIGTVTQDGKLFMGDVLNNITIATPGAGEDEAWEAAELAGIADDIRAMPMGMQTLVTEGGSGFSGGQRQRLMIARAVCGGKRIVILDEATSALDNRTQKHVIDSLDSMSCTRLVVAHRLSTVRHCDRILMVDDGHIAEEGTFDELVAKGGLFAQLVERQRLDS